MTVLYDLWSVQSVDADYADREYGGPTVNLNVDFQLCRGSSPLIPAVFKGVYIHTQLGIGSCDYGGCKSKSTKRASILEIQRGVPMLQFKAKSGLPRNSVLLGEASLWFYSSLQLIE